jgi:hypothetical protein
MKTIIINKNIFDISDDAYAFIISSITESKFNNLIREEASGFIVLDSDNSELCELLLICVITYSNFLFERFNNLETDIKYQFFKNRIEYNGKLTKEFINNKQYDQALLMLEEIFRIEMFMDSTFNRNFY